MKTVPEKQPLTAWKHEQAGKLALSVRFTDMDMIDIVSEKRNCGLSLLKEVIILRVKIL